MTLPLRDLARFCELGFLLSDPYESGHGLRVADRSVMLAKALGIKPREIVQIRYGARLHDIGKMLVRSDILNKTGKLSNAEQHMVRHHAELGYRWIQPFDLGEIIADIIRHHHEKVDGSGYPEGLKDERVTVYARMVSIADAFDALTNPRPYRPHGIEPTRAIETMRKEGGFDMELLETFAKKTML